MNYSNKLKQRIKKNITHFINKNIVDEKKSAFIFNEISDNFNVNSYKNINDNINWKNRLEKKHTTVKNVYEMQSSNSSDALLMNIFCHPKFKNWKGMNNLFKIDKFDDFEFGWNPEFKNEKSSYKTEIDLKFNDIIIEAKFTEENFKTQIKTVVESYENFDLVFEKDLLKVTENNEYKNYQLIRNILTAYKYNFRFILIIDESRIDLIKEFLKTIISIKNLELRNKIEFITWQEIVDLVGDELKEYMKNKYF